MIGLCLDIYHIHTISAGMHAGICIYALCIVRPPRAGNSGYHLLREGSLDDMEAE